MFRYILRRILYMIPVLLGVTLIIFTILEFTPGDPARQILGEDVDEATIEEYREELGLNKPFLVRFGNYVLGVLKGDFGTSYVTKRPLRMNCSAATPRRLSCLCAAPSSRC